MNGWNWRSCHWASLLWVLIARFCNHPMGRQSLPHSVVSRWEHCPKLPVHAARLSSSVRNTTFLARHILLPLLPRNLLVSDETMTGRESSFTAVSRTHANCNLHMMGRPLLSPQQPVLLLLCLLSGLCFEIPRSSRRFSLYAVAWVCRNNASCYYLNFSVVWKLPRKLQCICVNKKKPPHPSRDLGGNITRCLSLYNHICKHLHVLFFLWMLNVTDSFTNCMLFLRIVGVILIAVDVLDQYKRYNASSVQCKVKLLFFREMFMNLDLSCNDCTCSIHQSYFIVSTSFSEKCWAAAFVAPNTCCMFTLPKEVWFALFLKITIVSSKSVTRLKWLNMKILTKYTHFYQQRIQKEAGG